MASRPTAQDRAVLVESWGGPLAPDVQFVEVRGGRVHVAAYNPDSIDGFPVTAEGVTDLLVGVVWTFCGAEIRKHLGGLEESAWPTAAFADEKLCQRCVAAVPENDRWRLFEHDQENPSE
jgi:hypothetical protein